MYNLKLSIAGEEYVGKTSIRDRLVGQRFQNTYIQTVGADFIFMEKVIEKKTLRFQIWDLAGSALAGSVYRSLINQYFTGASGILLVYDVTRPQTLENIWNWMDTISKTIDHACFLLLGNKIDLYEPNQGDESLSLMNNSFITQLQKEFPNTIDSIDYFDTSAKTGTGIEDAFESLVRNLYHQKVKLTT